MMKKDLAQALGISASMVSRLAKQGMPVDSVDGARIWRSRVLDMGRMKDVRPFTGPVATRQATPQQGPRLGALRALLKISEPTISLALDDWILLVDYCIAPEVKRRLRAIGIGAEMLTASGLARLIYDNPRPIDGRIWFNFARDVFENADTAAPEFEE